MRVLSSVLMVILLALVFYLPAHAAPKPGAEKKEPLVLMPLKGEGVDKDMLGTMEGAVAEGLQDRYRVYFGENVAKKAREIFSKETVKKECDETMCLQDIGIAFQSELIASAQVVKKSGGYFLSLKILNINDNTLVFSNSLPCKGCDEYQVVDTLKLLAGGEQTTHALTGGNITSATVKGSGATPSGATSKPPVSAPLGGDGFTIEDLDAQARLEEERNTSGKAKWDKYQSEMKTSYAQLESYEKRDISKELKIAAWERFLTSYKEDNPYSKEDDNLRDKASVRIRYLKNVEYGGDLTGIWNYNLKESRRCCHRNLQIVQDGNKVTAFFVEDSTYGSYKKGDVKFQGYRDGQHLKVTVNVFQEHGSGCNGVKRQVETEGTITEDGRKIWLNSKWMVLEMKMNWLGNETLICDSKLEDEVEIYSIK